MHLFSNLKSPTPKEAVLFLWLIFALLLAANSLVFRHFFPLPEGRLGHDYALALTGWFDGHIWFSNNGLNVPWFTPSFCAGQPFFPDPQSTYYSVPQFLAILAGPVTAAYLTLCIAASLMFWGGYLLARRVFTLDQSIAVLVGGLLMFNGFLSHRLIIGHTSFHGFALTPLLAVLLLMPIRSKINAAGASVIAGLIVGYWVQSGFGTLILAGGLAVFLVGLLYCLNGGSLKSFVIRGALAGLTGVAISAAKLVATFSFLAHFPRTFYLLPGAASLYDAATLIGGALFLPSQWAHDIGSPKIVNLQFILSPHEWAFNFSFAAAALIIFLLAWSVLDLVRSKPEFHFQRGRPAARNVLILCALLAGLAWPLAFNYFEPHWNAFLKTVPVINTASTPLRWIIVYIPFIALGTGLLLQKYGAGKRWLNAVIAACLVATVAQALLEDRTFYESQDYDSRPVALSDQFLSAGKFSKQITVLGTNANVQAGPYQFQLGSNNTFVAGMSQVFCYNPVFGYQLEKFSAEGLLAGPVLTETNRFLNLKNPACYVYPKENNCQPGDRFRSDQLEEAKNFVAYRPYAFKFSHAQSIANTLNLSAIIAIALALMAWLCWAVWSARQLLPGSNHRVGVQRY